MRNGSQRKAKVTECLTAILLLLLSVGSGALAQPSVVVSVLDQGGSPMSGLSVYAFDGATYTNESATTNTAGEAVFDLASGDYRFRIDRNGTRYFTGEQNHCVVPGCQTVSHSLPSDVEITVTSSAGAAEPGLSVYAFNGSDYAGKSAVTDSQGRAVLTLLPGDYRFRVDRNGTRYFTAAENHCTVPGCEASFVEVPELVSVSVLSSEGLPEAGISVYAFDGDTYANKSAVTDASGEAVFTLLPGSYRFRADKNGTQYHSAETNHCDPTLCTSVDIEVPEAVTVTVLSSDGTPEAGLNVYAFDDSSYVNKSAVTDANGQAPLQLLQGNYRFRVDKNGTRYYTDTTNHCAVPGCETASLEVPKSVSLMVSNYQNVPQAGLNVYAFDGAEYAGKSAVTDANGLATFTLLPGQYRFRVDRNGTRYFTDDVNHCSLPGCASVTQMIPDPVTLRVEDTAGRVISGANVYAFSGGSYSGKSAVTNQSGEASFSLLEGDYRFRIDAQGGQLYTAPTDHCSVPGCTTVTHQIPALLSSYISDAALATCVSGAADANGWESPEDVTSLSCEGMGVTSLEGLENFGNLTSLSLANNPITRLDPLSQMVSLASLDLSGATSIECSQLGEIASVLDGISLTHPANCVGEGAQVFSVDNPGEPTTNLFGFAMDVTPTGDIISGAITYRPGTDGYDGSVYLLDGASGEALLELVSPSPSGTDYFGWAVAGLSDGNIAVGAWQGGSSGAVHVFSGHDGSLLHSLYPDTVAGARFGYSLVAGPDGSLMVGAPDEAGGGAVYLIDSFGAVEGALSNPTSDVNARFGFALSVADNGDIAIGAPGQNVAQTVDSGAAYIYMPFTQSPLLTINNPTPQDYDSYGASVEWVGSALLSIGARQKDNAAPNDGSIFVHSGIDGSMMWSLGNPVADDDGYFGSVLSSTSDGYIVAGAPMDDSGEENSGRAFVFRGSDGALVKVIDNPDAANNVNFGQAIAITPYDQIAVGSPGANNGYGKLYLFASIDIGETNGLLNNLPLSDSALASCLSSNSSTHGWATVSDVTTLDCAAHGIADLSGIDTLTSLESLNLSSNAILDVAPLGSMTQLSILDLWGNDDLQCGDLDSLHALLSSTEIGGPAHCTNSSVSLAKVESVYNALGQRVSKEVDDDPSTILHFIYDQQGRVIAEIDASTGEARNEYVYVNGEQIAMVRAAGGAVELRHIVNDHLATPQLLVDEGREITWQAEYEPFGSVDEVVGEESLSLRFPGQYADKETGLHYNYFRDYAPKIGRYIQSDPIGLTGGLNTYAYVYNNPIMLYDPYGLWAIGDPLPQIVVDFSAGLGDALLLSFGDELRGLAGAGGGVNECSSVYQAGGWTSFAFGGARLAYAGLVKGGSILASSGAAASAFRDNVKVVFRGGLGRNWRPPNLSKYPTDEALRAAAGRSNPGVNAYGAGVAGAGAAGGSGCGCEQ